MIARSSASLATSSSLHSTLPLLPSHIFLLMSYPAKPKKGSLKKASVRFYESAKRRKTVHRYTEYSGGVLGTSRASTSTIDVGPKTTNEIDNHESEWIDEPLDDPALDAAYLEHMAQMATSDRVKRVRPKGVRIHSKQPLISLTILWIQDESLRNWEPQCDSFLKVLIEIEGRARPSQLSCVDCGNEPGDFECAECYGREMRCGFCIVQVHRQNPLHKIQVSNLI